MGVRHRLNPTFALLALVASSGCKRHPPPPQETSAPVDRLAPGEQPLSKDKALGLPLPRASRVGAKFGGTVAVASQLSPEELANFVRVHVRGGKVTAGSTLTQFEDVLLPDDPKRHLSIEIRPARLAEGARSEMVVKDVSPPNFAPDASVEDRWKSVGMTPDGRLLDPKHLE